MPVIMDCIQGTHEWRQARNGLITASLFEMIMAQKKNGQKTQKYHAVMMKLAGEKITGTYVDEGTTIPMRRGTELEPKARQLYGSLTQTEPQTIGFVLSDDRKKGFSPDAFIGTDGILEIKTKKPELLIPYFDQNTFPAEHKAQCQGGLWIAQREWIDLMIYWPDMPLLIKRAYRDEAYIRKLENEISRFNEALDRMVHKIKNADTKIIKQESRKRQGERDVCTEEKSLEERQRSPKRQTYRKGRAGVQRLTVSPKRRKIKNYGMWMKNLREWS
ncbi:lambda exonuclease family protein [Bartonella sp. F02]|uniref:lambda exonuclease family protein n=1 Tax=Bartonella sp. F02 TaxID=2967262 RepID=UPI0022A8F021|nr:lambda exonuclease family protein [Bartonella sp. F02]MCZ2328858.1 YqaJ viral recombinase family protein [Bartonella sp. F02]